MARQRSALSKQSWFASLLETIPNVRPFLWTDAFPIGTMTFEALEKVARRSAGAILLASPDDESVVRGNPERVPRTNVILEWGYLYFEGLLQLLLPRSGQNGTGTLIGRVFSAVGSCKAIFRLVDVENEVRLHPDGSITLFGESYTRQLDEPITGIPPQEDGFAEELPAPNRFEMQLSPNAEGHLVGEHLDFRGDKIKSKAKVVCVRLKES